MNKYILGIDGMRCGMCEIHVEDAIRKGMKIKKVRASHLKKNVIVIAESNFGEYDFKQVLDSTGYRITSFARDIAIKKLFGWR